MKQRYLLTSIALIFICLQVSAQDIFKDQRSGWLAIAKATQPTLIITEKRPLAVVTISKNEKSFQGYSVNAKERTDSFYISSMKKQSGVILDFGEHLTGLVTFKIEDLQAVADAALRLKFTFSETPAEAVVPFDPYTGALSRGWLQDEIVTVSDVPSTITIPRRVAFRFLRIEVLGSSTYSDFKISDIYVKATTSAKQQPTPDKKNRPGWIEHFERMYADSL